MVQHPSHLEPFDCFGKDPHLAKIVKRSTDVLGGKMGKNIFILTFCVTKWFQRKSHFKKIYIIKKNEKLQRTHNCFPFHHGTCIRTVFKFSFVISPRNNGTHFTRLQFTTQRKRKRKQLRHACIRSQKPYTNKQKQTCIK